MAEESVFRQAAAKGAVFSFVFYLFLMMSALPIIMLFFGSFVTWNPAGLILPLLFGAILARDIKTKNLFRTCRDMAVLNLTMWFLLGLFPLLQSFMAGASGMGFYLLLLPYGIISGYLVYYLLSRADGKRPRRVLWGGVAVSTMMAAISAINGAVTSAINELNERLVGLVATGGEAGSPFISSFGSISLNPHLSFLIVLVLFNVPFIRYYWKRGKGKQLFLAYLIPIAVYLALTGIWFAVKDLLLGAIAMV
ncbi:hypothetical protein JXA12_05870 [Candidatus Woesearchaeota archaeon]|nr:hypothetical protein [Candidatus Woesearchaeota archaeon]